MEQQYETIDKFDRSVGGLLSGNNLHTKPTTIEEVDKLTGQAETFIIQTIRDEDGDHVVVKFVDKEGVKRLILSPRVAYTIMRQRDALTSKSRSNKSKAAAHERKLRGELPGFMRKKLETKVETV